MFWEFYQQSQIHDAKQMARAADSKAQSSKEYFRLLEDRMASLALACQALWETLEEQTDITREQLLAKMEEVDLRDGRKDGKLSKTVDACPSCNRKTSRRRAVCLYCGCKLPGEIFGFRGHPTGGND